MNIAVSLANFQGLSKPLSSESEVFMSGYTKKPNFIIDSGLMSELSGNAYKVLDFLIRMAYGFGSNSCQVGSSLVRMKTGISKDETFSRAVRELEQLKLVHVSRKTGATNVYTLTLNHYRQSVVPPINGSTPHEGGYTTPDEGDKTTPDNGGTVKDIFKENFKESIYVQNTCDQAKQNQIIADQKSEAERLEKLESEKQAKANSEAKAKAKSQLAEQAEKNFELFWSAYPNKKSKKAAFEKFKRIDFNKNSFESIISALEKQKQSNDWTKNGGQFVPMPQTWILNERWTDEIQIPVQHNGHTDVNGYWADKLQAQQPATDFVPTLVLGEEFN